MKRACLLCGEDLDEHGDRRCDCAPRAPRSHLLEVVMTARACSPSDPETMRVALRHAARAHREEPN